jgi:peptidoglycan-N-acetylglucosamine deacetylase
MKRPILLGALAFLAASSLLSASLQKRSSDHRARREVAVTFDDLPAAPGNARVTEINKKLVESLTRHMIPAIGFVNKSRLYARGETDARIELLQMWLDAGLELGNHTFSHIQIDGASLDEYKAALPSGSAVT